MQQVAQMLLLHVLRIKVSPPAGTFGVNSVDHPSVSVQHLFPTSCHAVSPVRHFPAHHHLPSVLLTLL